MATVNLGRIKPVFRGAYSGSTAYVVDDIVTSGNQSYICIQAHGAGTQAVTQTAYWSILAAKGADGTDVGTTLTTQGDILYRDGSGLQRLAKGTASQLLRMNSGANAPEWATVSSGTIKQIKMGPLGGTQYSHTSQSYTDTGAQFQLTITPTASSNKILLYCQVAPQMSNQGRCYYTFNKAGDSSGNGDLESSNGVANAENVTQHGNGWLSFFYMDTANSTNALTYKLRQKTSNSTSLATSVAQDYNLMMAIELDQTKVV